MKNEYKIIHKRAVFESGFVCGWNPKLGEWVDTDVFWDKITCGQCLAKRKKVNITKI